MIPEPRDVNVVGQPRVHSTPRPPNMATYFSSGDDKPTGEVGDGDALLIYNMAATDTEKSVDVSYSEDVKVKDGALLMEGAPLGATVCATVWDPTGTTQVGAFVRRAAILGSGWYPFNTDDSGDLPAGYILRITVRNSDGTGDQEPAKAFKVAARVEMYRTTTVGAPP